MPGPVSSTLVCADFPQGVGNRMVSILDHKGPASYTQIGIATPPTGGDVLTAAECGLKSISAVSGQISDDGQFSAEATMTVGSAGEVSQIRLVYTVVSTGAQVAGATNLSARSFRLIVWGR